MRQTEVRAREVEVRVHASDHTGTSVQRTSISSSRIPDAMPLHTTPRQKKSARPPAETNTHRERETETDTQAHRDTDAKTHRHKEAGSKGCGPSGDADDVSNIPIQLDEPRPGEDSAKAELEEEGR